MKTSDVIYISAEKKYVNLPIEKDAHLIRDTMTNLEQRLNPSKFKRIHHSYIVNIDLIKEIQPWSHWDYVVILKNGTKLTLSRRFRDQLFASIDIQNLSEVTLVQNRYLFWTVL